MNADYIKSVVDKANELIALIENAAANPRLEGDQFKDWETLKKVAISKAKQAAEYAARAETIN